MRMISQRLCIHLMGSGYPELVRCLSSNVIRLGTSILSIAWIIGGIIAILSFACDFMPRPYLLTDIMSKSLSFRRGIGRVINPRFRVGGEGWRVFFALCSDALVFAYYYTYILNHHLRQGLVWCVVMSGVCGIYIHLFLGFACVGTRVSVSGDSYVLSVKKGLLLLRTSRLHYPIEL